MIKTINCPALSSALEKLKEIISKLEETGRKTVIFCEDRLTLAAECTVCAAVEGTFSVSVYTLSRFLTSERGKNTSLLSKQGSVMAIRRIIEENRGKLRLFSRLSASSAAGAVYDTIALLYSSKISPEDVDAAVASGILESKLRDIAVIYSAYNDYLEKSGKTDRNAYLATLPEVIENSRKIAGNNVIFLGFQSFTRSAADCIRAAFSSAADVYGLFIGGSEEIYVNEGAATFSGIAKSFGGDIFENYKGTFLPEAEHLRKNLFEPLSLLKDDKLKTNAVHIFEAADEEEELEFIAASIKKQVLDNGERYAKISVMLPDVAGAERDLKRVFSQYKIPYYADRRHTLGEHPLCGLLTHYLSCVVGGCPAKDVDEVISSPMFPADISDKDMYRNYALRYAAFRGGVKREPDREVLMGAGYDFEGVQRVRKTFLKGLELLPANGNIRGICEGLRKLSEEFGIAEKLKALSEKYKDEYPTASAFSARVYDGVLGVIAEAEEISEGVTLKEFIKILKSGFGALEISLIPPKADAVFVGDIAKTANTGSNVVFAARLTSAGLGESEDTALLTDRDIAALEKVNVEIAPKIRQVNLRRREIIALNICAFRRCLYLSYPIRLGGEESGANEIISYARGIFLTPLGNELKPLNLKKINERSLAAPYYCSEKLPAIKRLYSGGATADAVYAALKERGIEEADEALTINTPPKVSDGKGLFASGNSISPTALETYFSCPYKNFMQQGLKLKEREEGVMRPLDTGNFIHAVLQQLAPEMSVIKTREEVEKRAEEISLKLLKTPAYASLNGSKSGEYTSNELVKEAKQVSLGAFEQLANSQFTVEKCEERCEIRLDGGIKIGGRIDRIDSCGDMVRIIDYKTGTVEISAGLYYMGLKLQLPLYLTAASKGRRAVGAYYFPASVEYKPSNDGVFRLQGFMDGSSEVVSASDTNIEPKKKSAYIDAYPDRKNPSSAMEREEFENFLSYSLLAANKAFSEMARGNIKPSPAESACEYCKMGGSCNFAAGSYGAERKKRSITCSEIAEVVKKRKGE